MGDRVKRIFVNQCSLYTLAGMVRPFVGTRVEDAHDRMVVRMLALF